MHKKDTFMLPENCVLHKRTQNRAGQWDRWNRMEKEKAKRQRLWKFHPKVLVI
jgi:hypothetical protein